MVVAQERPLRARKINPAAEPTFHVGLHGVQCGITGIRSSRACTPPQATTHGRNIAGACSGGSDARVPVSAHKSDSSAAIQQQVTVRADHD